VPQCPRADLRDAVGSILLLLSYCWCGRLPRPVGLVAERDLAAAYAGYCSPNACGDLCDLRLRCGLLPSEFLLGENPCALRAANSLSWAIGSAGAAGCPAAACRALPADDAPTPPQRWYGPSCRSGLDGHFSCRDVTILLIPPQRSSGSPSVAGRQVGQRLLHDLVWYRLAGDDPPARISDRLGDPRRPSVLPDNQRRELSGSRASAASSRSLSFSTPRPRRRRRRTRSKDVVQHVVLEHGDVPVGVLLDGRDVEDADDAVVDQLGHGRHDLALEPVARNPMTTYSTGPMLATSFPDDDLPMAAPYGPEARARITHGVETRAWEPSRRPGCMALR
jgi:hypothetical protein